MNIEIPISEVGREGQGVGFDPEKNIYFVRGAIPGDRVEVKTSQSKRYRDASLVKVVTASDDRLDPVCPHFLDCGGCDWLQWKYESQLEAKERTVRHVLTRAGLTALMVHPIMAATKTLGYRSRVQLRKLGNQVGFFRRDSNDIAEIESCALATPKINEEIKRLRKEPATPETQKIELVETAGGNVVRSINATHAFEGFQQVHAEQNSKLQRYVKSLVAQFNEPALVLELFAGNGNLTFEYLREGDRVLGIDSHQGSVALANRLSREKGVGDRAEFHCHWVCDDLAVQLPKEFFDRYDTLILDPPRSGVGAHNLTRLLGPRVRRIIYVSCSALTFSQDVKPLSEKGFVFRSLQPIDMFPQTRHVELVGYFLRSS